LKTTLPVSAVFLLAVIVSGCNSKSACEQAESKLRSCGLLGAGNSSCGGDVPENIDCLAGCIKSASCTQLDDAFCQDENGPVETCQSACQTPSAGQDKACGDGGKYSESDRCDGFEFCDNGADELGCPVFACKSGEKVPETSKCDGEDDCADSSDELGCPVFACKDGEKIPADFKCDGEEDCSDASDELGCADSAELICK
jgi:Low-density lipoprotein receptor domain class A